MTSRNMLAAAALAVTMTAAAVLGAITEAWWLLTLAAMSLLSATFLAVMDTNRRVRYIPGRMTKAVRPLAASLKKLAAQRSEPVAMPPPPSSPLPTQEDVLGTVRVLQAQYIGRLDRLQGAVEETLQELRDAPASPPEAGAPDAGADAG